MAATAVRRVCVVGAGPAGIIATAALSQAGHSVTWVDSARAFRECGRLGKFHNVHANTKVKIDRHTRSAAVLTIQQPHSCGISLNRAVGSVCWRAGQIGVEV